MSYNIELSTKTAIKYLESIVNKVYKIIPLYEEESEFLYRYVDSLVFEIDGTVRHFDGLLDDDRIISVIGILEGISTDLYFDELKYIEDDMIKPEAFQCINLLTKIIEDLSDRHEF